MMRKVMFVLILCLLLAACSSPQTDESPQVDSATLEQGCLDGGGIFLAEYNECENVSEAACTDLGGTFDACASACRHEPEAEFCTAQCVPLCSFGAEGQLEQPESVFAQVGNPLECNLLPEPRVIGAVTANYICQAPGAFLTFVDTSPDPWTAGYFTTDTQSTEVTYGPERVEVVPNDGAQ